MDKINLIATTTFGLEATAKREVMRLRKENPTIGDIKATDGRINFTGDFSAIPDANIWLRSADRVLLNIGEFEAYTFDELFEKTKALPWSDWITKKAKFTVIGKSVQSTLFSVSDCQSIVKKAVVEKLKLKYDCEWFEESGPEYTIQVALLRDTATLTIDTTGAGLHKRGYRENAVMAPLKETLAYALIELSYWRKDRILFDPMCGTGTIPIEAALEAKNIAPGIARRFASDEWVQLGKKMWKDARAKAYSVIDTGFRPEIYASDIDPMAIELAKSAARKAGVDDCIRFEVRPMEDCVLPSENGVLICNPPYGERMGTAREVEKIYKDLGELMRGQAWSAYVITSNEDFEKLFGRKADATRKLYNGMLKTNYYQFYGPKPKKVN